MTSFIALPMLPHVTDIDARQRQTTGYVEAIIIGGLRLQGVVNLDSIVGAAVAAAISTAGLTVTDNGDGTLTISGGTGGGGTAGISTGELA